MLKVIKVQDPSYRRKWLSKRNLQTDCFLVSDIKTKLSVETELLKNRNFLPGFCVMRAYEFYEEIFYSLNLKWHIVSDLFVRELFSDFCFQHKANWVKNLQNSKSFFSFFNSFLPMLLHVEGAVLFQEWLQGRGRTVFWKSWMELAQEFFLFLDSKKILPESGRKALLSHCLPSIKTLNFKKEKIYVDLSFSMDLCELEIFKSLSRYTDIYILSPHLRRSGLGFSAVRPSRARANTEYRSGSDGSVSQNTPAGGNTEFRSGLDGNVSQNIHARGDTEYRSGSDGNVSQNIHASGNIDKKPENLNAIDPVSSLFSEHNFDVYQALEEELSLKQFFFLDSSGEEKEGFFQGKSKGEAGKKIFKVRAETQLEELKKAAVQICKWLQRGIPPKDIALFAPDMEAYWFALGVYFQKENIPVAKSVFAKALDYPEVCYFLAALRIHASSFSFEDLEYFSFFRESKKDFSYFKTCYFRAPERELSKKLFFRSRVLPAHKPLTGSQFVNWALSFWPKEGSSFVWEKVSQIFLKLPLEESLKVSSWLKLFESEIQALDLELKTEDPGGISCLSFNALSSSGSSHLYILGLDEEALRTEGPTLLNERERKEILEELGFPLAFSHPHEKIKNFLWFLQSSHHREVYLSFSSCDLKGNVQTPSLLYFLSEALFSAEKKALKGDLLWEAQRKQRASGFDIGDSKEFKLVKPVPAADLSPASSEAGDSEKFKMDFPDEASAGLGFNAEDSEKFKIVKASFQNKKRAVFHTEEIRLSPSGLKTYIDCPFKYAAEKLFFVREKGLIDRELSPLSKGAVAHKLFENVLSGHPDLKLSEEQLEDLLEEIKPEAENFVYERQWLLVKEDLKQTLNAFLQKEREERRSFPSLKAKALEREISVFWNQTKGELSPEGKYPFIAKADRIDKEGEGGGYVIRDYKASAGALTHISGWIQEGREELQLTFYAQALRKGLIPGLPKGPVSSVFYSFYREDFSAKGFVEKGSALESLLGERAKGPKKEKEYLEKAISLSNHKTKEAVKRMEEGDFTPNPREKKLCETCAYRSWCRTEVL